MKKLGNTMPAADFINVDTFGGCFSSLYMRQRSVSYPSPGILSHCPVIPAIKFLCIIITPLGLPVEPLVYITKAKSVGTGLLGRMFATKSRRKTVIYSYLLSKLLL